MNDAPQVVRADRGDAGQRLDRVLTRHLSPTLRVSRARIQRWIAAGLVAVDDVPVRRLAARVPLAARIAVSAPVGSTAARPQPEDLPIDVLYEDELLLIVNKPPGVVVHPSYKQAHGTLLNALLWHLRDTPAARPSLVNRIDKGTSGAVLVAKSAQAHAALQLALASASASKEYLAVVHGLVRPARGHISLALARDAWDRRRVVPVPAGGRPATTEYVRLGRPRDRRDGPTLLCCRLVTGRTHQIRVHLAARGWPIVGDRMYGSLQTRSRDGVTVGERCARLDRPALHAWRIGFRHPFFDRPLLVAAPLPADLLRLADEAGLAVPLEEARLTIGFFAKNRGATSGD